MTIVSLDERDKLARLPKWVGELVKRLESLPGALADEAANLRRKLAAAEERNKRLEERMEAMTELFRCAALGGSEGAKTVVKVLEGYGIFPPMSKTE